MMTVVFFNDTATTEIYTLSLHDALPIYREQEGRDAELLDEEVRDADRSRAGRGDRERRVADGGGAARLAQAGAPNLLADPKRTPLYPTPPQTSHAGFFFEKKNLQSWISE